MRIGFVASRAKAAVGTRNLLAIATTWSLALLGLSVSSSASGQTDSIGCDVNTNECPVYVTSGSSECVQRVGDFIFYCARSPLYSHNWATFAEPAAFLRQNFNESVDAQELGKQSKAKPVNQGALICGNPFNVVTGNKVHQEYDYVGTGRLPLTFSRTLNTGQASNAASPLGAKWSLGFPRLESWYHMIQPGVPGGTLWRGMIFIAADGQRLQIKSSKLIPDDQPPEPVTFSYMNGKPVRLYQDTGGVWTLLDKTMEYRFDESGRIILQIDRPTGEYLKYSYDSPAGEYPFEIEHVSGRKLALAYDAQGRLDTLTDPAGNVTTYEYNIRDNLWRVTYPATATGSATKTYHYEDSAFPDHLTKTIDEIGVVKTWAYDSSGRTIRNETDTGINVFEVVSRTYVNDQWQVRTRNALGKEATHTFEEIAGRKKAIGTTGDALGNCEASSSSITYDTNGFYDLITDREGNVTDYDHDVNGRPSKITEGFGTADARTTNYTFNDNTELLEVVENSQQKTTFFHGLPGDQTQGRLQSITLEDKVGGNPIRVYTIAYPNPDTTAEGSELVREVVIDGPRADVTDTTTIKYDAQGKLTDVINAANHSTTFGVFDARGYATQITYPTGMVTDLVYNNRGWLTSKTDTVDTPIIGGSTVTQARTTTFAHRADGSLDQVTFPDGTYLAFDYDNAGRLYRVNNQLEEAKVFLRDSAGNVTGELTQHGLSSPVTHKSVTYEYDALSRLERIVDGNGNDELIRYNKNDLVKLVTDANGFDTDYVYNSRNELEDVLNPDTGVVSMSYDDNALLESVVDAIAVTTSFTRNGFGEIETETSPDSGTWSYTYDEAGNLKDITDAKGHTTRRKNYDALNRLGKIEHPDLAGDTTFDYDQSQAGYLDKMSDYTGHTEFEYNQAGQLTKKTAHVVGIDMIIEYQYDVAGRVGQIKMPGGTELFYTYDQAGRVERIEVDHSDPAFVRQDLASNIQYKPFGPMTQVVLGSLQTRTLTYDNNYQLQTLTSGSVMQKSYGYDAKGNITTITDGLGAPLRTYGYDTMDRLDLHSGPDGVFDYRYDKNGNRESKNSPTDNYAYYSGTNRLQSAPEFTVTYDANGTATQRGSLLFGVNHRHRIWQVVSAGPTFNNYFYNSFGERVYKYVHNQSFNQRFVYGDGGLLLHERGSQGTIDYVYLNGQPIAMIKDGSIFYLHTDHLGRPEVATNWAGVVAWSIEANAWSSDSVSGGLTVNLRFPGQYFDAESGLHYNYHRFYDPVTGRYLSSDPTGLGGGSNRFAYADQSPVSMVDPLGLSAIFVPKPLIGAKPLPGPLTGAKPLPMQSKPVDPAFPLPKWLERTFDQVWPDPEQDEECKRLIAKHNRITKDIAKREKAIAENPLNLPERIGRPEMLRDTVRGHRKIIRKYEKALRKLEDKIEEKCAVQC